MSTLNGRRMLFMLWWKDPLCKFPRGVGKIHNKMKTYNHHQSIICIKLTYTLYMKNRILLVVSYRQLTAKHIINKLQNLLDNNITFPQALGGKPLLVSKEPPTNLNQILTSNNKQPTHLCQYENQTLQNLKCLLWPHIDIDNSITGLSKYTKIIDTFTFLPLME